MYYLKVTDKVEYADSKLCRVRINPSYKDDKGLIAHEEMHIKQWYAFMLPLLLIATFSWFNYREDVALSVGMLAVFAKDLLYTTIPFVRYRLELMAYKEQLKHAPNREATADRFADVILEHYDTKDSKYKIVKKLLK